MSLHDALHQQILAFHAAIIDDCDRAARPEETDATVLRLRNSVLALAKLQLAMVVYCDREVITVRRTADPEAVETPAALPPDQPLRAQAESPSNQKNGPSSAQHRVMAGDALSRFVSYRLEPDESPHDVWQALQSDEPPKRRRNPALPRAGFRSPSG